jgi:hypothetical protein
VSPTRELLIYKRCQGEESGVAWTWRPHRLALQRSRDPTLSNENCDSCTFCTLMPHARLDLSLLECRGDDGDRTRDPCRDIKLDISQLIETRINGWLTPRPKELLAMFTAPLSNRRPLSIKPLPISGKICIFRHKRPPATQSDRLTTQSDGRRSHFDPRLLQ